MPVFLNVVYLILLLCVTPWILTKRVLYGRYKDGWRQKLLGTTYTSGLRSRVVWIHAVSVGEVQVARTLVERFEKTSPEVSLAISVSTDSGIELARKLFPSHFVFFAPLDFTWAVRRTIRALRPELIVLTELELWPNWIRIAGKMNCRIAVINGRLSERSFLGYQRLKYFLTGSFRSVDWVGAQSAIYASRFVAMGTNENKVTVTGNIKFDGAAGNRNCSEVLERKQLLGLNESVLVWCAGSTQAPEERLILETFQELRTCHPNLKLILVPRHAERFSEVASLLQNSKLKHFRRSQVTQPVSINDWDVFLGDSVGELRWWWGLADIGFVGGSFGDRGGQNMIEPCAYGVATSFGPNTKNFADIVRLLLDENACKQFEKPKDLLPWMLDVVENPLQRQRLAERAQSTCLQHRGALDQTWENLQKLLRQ